MKEISGDSFIGSHYYGKEEENAALEVIRSQSLFRYDGVNLLKKTEQFEEAVKKYLQVPYAIACSSGYAALKLCCIALGIGPGDEVIMSPFTFIASAGAVLSCGAVPVFAEVDDTMNLDVAQITRLISKRTKAVMAIHIQGVPCNMDLIISICREHNLFVIEDCAQAFGAECSGKRVGSIGDAGAFSLQSNKVISCGEGGIFTCRTEEQFMRARNYHDNGAYRNGYVYPSWLHETSCFGENFKITELHSALALEQLKKIDHIIERQREIYCELIPDEINNLFTCRRSGQNTKPVPVSLCMIFKSETECRRFITAGVKEGIPLKPYWDSILTTLPLLRDQRTWHESRFPYSFHTDYKINDCPFTEEYVKKTAWLPVCPRYTDEDIAYMKAFFNCYSTQAV